MTLFAIIVAACVFAAGYYYGKNFAPSNSHTSSNKKNKGYSPQEKDIESHDDNEMASIKTQEYFVNEDYEDNQKEIDKLMQELNELKKKEKKYQAEVQMLKTQLKNKPSTSTPTPEGQSISTSKKEYGVKDLDDLINDHEINSLVESSAKFEGNQLIDTEELQKEIEDEMEQNLLK